MVEEMLAFWRARLAEDEATAREAAGLAENWVAEEPAIGIVLVDGEPLIEGHITGLTAHIARHDPARALRCVRAQRAVIEECVRALGYPKNVPFFNLARRVIAASVAEWAGHPEFRAEWAA